MRGPTERVTSSLTTLFSNTAQSSPRKFSVFISLPCSWTGIHLHVRQVPVSQLTKRSCITFSPPTKIAGRVVARARHYSANRPLLKPGFRWLEQSLLYLFFSAHPATLQRLVGQGARISVHGRSARNGQRLQILRRSLFQSCTYRNTDSSNHHLH